MPIFGLAGGLEPVAGDAAKISKKTTGYTRKYRSKSGLFFADGRRITFFCAHFCAVSPMPLHLSKPYAVIFDMDGVLVDSNPAHKIALRAFCQRHGFDLSDDQLREKIYGRTNRDWITRLFGELPEETLLRYADEKEALYREIFAADIAPVKGLIRFLDLLDAHGIPKAIATSAPAANVLFTLGHTGTEGRFGTILDETFVSKGKPDPEIYLKTCAALGLAPAQCIVIEDSLSGVAAAQAAGCSVVGITTTHTADELAHTDLIISDFDDLSATLFGV